MPIFDIATLLAEAKQKALPAVCLFSSEGEATSRVGGAPDLAEDIAWPTRDGRPLSFLVQLDCATLRAASGPDWLPATGMLFFFYDIVEMPWGFDPADRDGWAVLHDARGPAATPRAVPDGIVTRERETPQLTPLVATTIQSIPSLDRLDGDLDWEDDDAQEQYYDLRSPPSRRFTVCHQVGGWPIPIQSDTMELQCALASGDVDCGGGFFDQSPRAQALASGAVD